MKPILKWAGNKYQLIDKIKSHLPPAKRLIEPFVGTAAVFFNTDYKKYVLAEHNADLIHLYLYLQNEGNKFIRYCKRTFKEENNNSDCYYALRDKFNHSKNPRQRAAIFLYLNKHGYNGLCRYNASGKYNVPFGRYKNVTFPEESLQFFHEKSKNQTIKCSDYTDTLKKARKSDIVYCDPPYVPLSDTSYFTAYSGKKFDQGNQIELATLANELANDGTNVIISNHDTIFTRKIYAKAKIISFPVQRYISCKGQQRKKVLEILALFGPGFK